MKILRVTLENLNSLRGEHEVDFTAPPIAGAGIFAITGPTGAGKTTLLDAVTLALYGRAARYGSEPNPADMMSRHTGECRAEVEFEVDGETFRAAWHLRRARGKPDGKIQPAKRYVYGAGGEVLTQKLREADEKIEEVSGLNYQRFMRSVLLAQGEFARFLKAGEDERAELLESLTGTGIFSDLSQRAYEEFSRRQNSLADEELKLGLIEPLATEQRGEIEAKIKTVATQLAELKTKLKAHSIQIASADSLQRQLETETTLLARQSKLEADREKQAARLERLKRHHSAAPLFPALDRYGDAGKRAKEQQSLAKAATAKSKQAHADKLAALAAAQITGATAITGSQKSLDAARGAANKAEKLRKDAEHWLKEHGADAALEDRVPDLVKNLANLSNNRRALATFDSEFAKLDTELMAAKAKSKDVDKALSQADAEESKAVAAQQVATEDLGKQLGGHSEEQWKSEVERLIELESKCAELQKLKKREAESSRQRESLTAKLPGSSKAIAALSAAHESATKLTESLQRHLSDSRLIASLEEHREALVDGKPCPLCGAEEHPYRDGEQKPSAPSSIEQQLNESQTGLKAAALAHSEATGDHKSLEAQIANGDAAIKSIRAETTELSGAIDSKRNQLSLSNQDSAPEKQLAEAKAKLRGIEAAKADVEKASVASLKTRHRAAEAATAAKSSAAAIINLEQRITKDRQRASSLATETEAACKSLGKTLQPFALDAPPSGTENQLQSIIEARAKAYAERERQLRTSGETLKSAHRDETDHSKALCELRKRIANLEKLIDGDAPTNPGEFQFENLDQAATEVGQIEKSATTLAATAAERVLEAERSVATAAASEAALVEALETGPLPDIEALRAARLAPVEFGELQSLDKALAEEEQQLKGALTSCSESLTKLRASKIPEGDTLAALRISHAELESAGESLTEQFATAKAHLKSDDDCLAKHKAVSASLAEQREQLVVWRQLSALIGSHDGKKFRVFAQGLSLDVLLRHANAHLARLNDRYLLARSRGEDLGLEIVDLFQASIARPMASLSGGESFLASLALALGLSDLAGRNVQIDSLFIDEGFGTLDAESLDIALAALESLRLQEKTVGVISHVDLLKERIATQIAVERGAGGTSTLRVISV